MYIPRYVLGICFHFVNSSTIGFLKFGGIFYHLRRRRRLQLGLMDVSPRVSEVTE